MSFWARQALTRSPRRAAGDAARFDDLIPLVHDIVPFHMAHNAEPEAVDLLLETEQLGLLLQHCDAGNFARTCLYLVSCASFLPEPEDAGALKLAHAIYVKNGRLPEALRCALKLADGSGDALVASTFAAASDTQVRRQLAYMLASAAHPVDVEDGPCACPDDAEALKDILGNAKLSEHYLALARDLDVMEAKTPEDIYKTHLVEGRAPAGAAAVDSARANLAATFVNAFVNAGFGQDKLMTCAADAPAAGGAGGASSDVSWVYKNKDHGKMAATASLGAILLWDVEGGLPQIDKYLYASEPQVVAGALLAVGIVNCGVRNEMDPAYALLYESVTKEPREVRCGATLGLGLAYAGTAREDIAALLCPIVGDDSLPMEVVAYAALSLGLVFVGTCHADSASAIAAAMLSRGDTELSSAWARLCCLALGLLFLGRGAAAEASSEMALAFPARIRRFARTTLDACAYAGTGNVLKVQAMLQMCGERVAPPAPEAPAPPPAADAAAAAPAAAPADGDAAEEDDDAHASSAAVLGIALIALGEELGAGMAARALEHVLQYGDAAQRKAVPLALALLSASNPALGVTDALGRLAHDPNEAVAGAAVLGLGLAAAGTNNARVAGQLRQLSSYYYKEPSLLYLVRCAQGLVHAGKGLLTAHPLLADRGLLHRPALASLAALAFCGLELQETLLGKHACLLYLLMPALRPRFLLTIDAAGKPLPVPVRVGEALDTVAQAGRPKSITGFQTHTTPVLLAVGDRAELATEQYVPVSPLLEGVVILQPNPEFIAATDDAKEKK